MNAYTFKTANFTKKKNNFKTKPNLCIVHDSKPIDTSCVHQTANANFINLNEVDINRIMAEFSIDKSDE